jgi:hypothetical protein
MLWGGRRSFGKVQLVARSRPNRVGCQSGHAANKCLLPLADLVGVDADLLTNSGNVFNSVAASIATLALNAALCPFDSLSIDGQIKV